MAQTQTFQVQGMSCGHCEKAIKQALLQVDPQAQIDIDRNAGRVDVTSSQGREALQRAIASEGYAVVA